MSRRNSHFQKAIRRELREEDRKRSDFIHEVSKEAYPMKNRKARRGTGR